MTNEALSCEVLHYFNQQFIHKKQSSLKYDFIFYHFMSRFLHLRPSIWLNAVYGITLLSIFTLPALASDTTDPIIASYYPDWKIYNQRDPYFPSRLPAEKLTHLIYAFLGVCGPIESSPINVRKLLKTQCKNKPIGTAIVFDNYAALNALLDGQAMGNYPYKGNFAQLHDLFQQHPHLTILPSFGGWTLSEPFHTVVVNPEYRKNFVESAMELLRTYPFFGGIQIDWEYPGGGGLSGKGANNLAAEKQGYTDLMKELRSALIQLQKTQQRPYELSSAINASPDKLHAINWTESIPYLDHLYVMSYDFLGLWDPNVGHHANLYPTSKTPNQVSISTQIQSLIEQGVPPQKIVMGVPFYGRGWQGVEGFSPTNMENLNSIGGIGKGSSLDEPGYFVYSDIVRHLQSNPRLGFTTYYDDKAIGAVLYNKKKQEYITFDDPNTLKIKGEFAQSQHLGGMFSWDITGDYQGQLLDAMRAGLLSSSGTVQK